MDLARSADLFRVRVLRPTALSTGAPVRFNGSYLFRPIVTWPGLRTATPIRGPFGQATYDGTLALLGHELAMLDATGVVIQLWLPESKIRVDGLPYAQARPDDPGVILSFQSMYGILSYPTDRFIDWQTNLRAIALSLESLRRVDRYGVTRRGEQYTGWKALPASTGSTLTTDAASKILGGITDLPASSIASDVNIARLAVRKARSITHPDAPSGDRERFNAVEAARSVLSSHYGISL